MNKWIIAGIISIATAGIGAYAQDGSAPEKKGPPKGEGRGPPSASLIVVPKLPVELAPA